MKRHSAAFKLPVEERAVDDRPDLLIRFLMLTVSAKGTVALLLALPVGALILALARRIWAG